MGEKTDLQIMIEHFEGLRKDIFEGVLQASERVEETEKRVLRLETEKLADRVFVQDVRDSLRRWETKIPELVHGAVKECMSFEVSELKEKLDKHIESDDPHPAVKKSKKEDRRRKLELAIAVSSSAGLLIALKLVLGIFGIRF